MVVTYTQEHVYEHPWDRVTSAAFRKFTDKPSPLTHVSDVHTLIPIHRGPQPHLLSTVRSLTVRPPPLPLPLRRILPSSLVVHCLEATLVDARRRRMDVVSRNATLRSLIEVEERCSFVPHPDDPRGRTLFRQETTILCKPLSALAALAGKVEERCAERFLHNSAKGREFVEAICRCLDSDPSSSPAL